MISTADRIACYLDAARIVCRYCGERAPYRFNKYPTVDGDHGELVHLARGVPGFVVVGRPRLGLGVVAADYHAGGRVLSAL